MAGSGRATNGLIINYMTLRRLIGWMGICLPFVVYLGNWVIFTHHVTACLLPSSKVPYSLSGYYYTHMRGVFTGTFWALGVFLVAYNGFGRTDQVITTLAGLSAIGIATFPTLPSPAFPADQTGTCGPLVPVEYKSSPHQTLIGAGHQASLVVLIVTLIAMAWRFRYDQPGEEVTGTARAIYLISAAGIAIGGAGAIAQNFLSNSVKVETPWLFWFEIVAILFFGLSWFVKGEAYRAFGNFRSTRSGVVAKELRTHLSDPDWAYSHARRSSVAWRALVIRAGLGWRVSLRSSRHAQDRSPRLRDRGVSSPSGAVG
jgi:hypothetical protein